MPIDRKWRRKQKQKKRAPDVLVRATVCLLQGVDAKVFVLKVPDDSKISYLKVRIQAVSEEEEVTTDELEISIQEEQGRST